MSSNDTLEAEESVALDTNVSSSPGSPPLVQVKVQRVAVSEDEYPAQPTVSFENESITKKTKTNNIILNSSFILQLNSC